MSNSIGTFHDFRKLVAGVVFTEPRFWEDPLFEVGFALDEADDFVKTPESTKIVDAFQAAYDHIKVRPDRQSLILAFTLVIGCSIDVDWAAPFAEAVAAKLCRLQATVIQ